LNHHLIKIINKNKTIAIIRQCVINYYIVPKIYLTPNSIKYQYI